MPGTRSQGENRTHDLMNRQAGNEEGNPEINTTNTEAETTPTHSTGANVNKRDESPKAL